VARDGSGALIGAGDFGGQVEKVFANLDTAVRAAGGAFADVVTLNYDCVDCVAPAELSAVRDFRDRFVDTQAPPASTFVVVRRLVRAEWLIEVEAVAAIGSDAQR
jgi:enamine deaminase RidA (YjgF/YER057c/UK114 family)